MKKKLSIFVFLKFYKLRNDEHSRQSDTELMKNCVLITHIFCFSSADLGTESDLHTYFLSEYTLQGQINKQSPSYPIA